MRHRKITAPINTNKHYVHRTNLIVASGTASAHVAVKGVVAPATATAAEVFEGSIVKAVHLEYWLLGSGATNTDTQFTLVVEKVQNAAASVTAAQIVNLGAYTNKRNILFSTQGVLGPMVDGAGSVPIIRNWVLIPKGKQRIALEDKIVTTMHALGTTINFCGLVIYKEYR